MLPILHPGHRLDPDPIILVRDDFFILFVKVDARGEAFLCFCYAALLAIHLVRIEVLLLVLLWRRFIEDWHGLLEAEVVLLGVEVVAGRYLQALINGAIYGLQRLLLRHVLARRPRQRLFLPRFLLRRF